MTGTQPNGTASTGTGPNRLRPSAPGQTVGPFFGFALPFPGGEMLVPPHRADAVRLHGYLLDGAGQPVIDGLLEIWQADASGQPVQQPGSWHRDGYTFTGWGRTPTDATGHYSFSTLLPARTPTGPDEAPGAPFIAVAVFARGLMHRLLTRVYLPEPEALAGDPFLASLPAERRQTLIAQPDGERSLRFDVHLQGEQETVFLSHSPPSDQAVRARDD